MKNIKVAVLGATGAVGTEIIKILEERKFPLSELVPLADKKDAGKKIKFYDELYTVKEATKDSFKDIDIVFVAVSDEVSKIFTPIAVDNGAIVIDNSNAYRLDKDVPLVIPEVNPDDINYNKGIISNPNCSTIIAMVAINALNKYSPVEKIVASTYQAVSGAGIDGIYELEEQTKAYLNNKNLENKVFQHQIAFNLIPHIDTFLDNGYTKEEMKLVNEGKKILNNSDVKITCTCVRVPVFRSHSESIMIKTKDKITVDKAKELLLEAKGVNLVDDIYNNLYPMPIDTSNQDLVYVGRIREDLSEENGLSLWCCGDQIRKGAATNAVQIAELLL